MVNPMIKKFVCIVCPNGCNLTVEGNGKSYIVSGNACKRGEQFALNEMIDPKRTICSTVRTVFPEVPVVPVRVSSDIPKDKIFEVMKEINKVVVTSKKIKRGDIIIKNVCGLGVNIICTSDILIKCDL